jgi:hypothetical protein
MGRLTDDTTRLVAEIHAGRGERGQLLRDLRQSTAEMKRAVAAMQAGFHVAHADRARRQQRTLRGFVLGLRCTVAGLRNAFANDLTGAHSAWVGAGAAAATGHGRRGKKWFGGESV